MLYSVLAGLLYLAALITPVYLLRRYHPLPWPVHLLAIAAGLAIGLAPGTALLDTTAGTFLYGVVVLFLLVWGAVGLFMPRNREARNLIAKAG